MHCPNRQNCSCFRCIHQYANDTQLYIKFAAKEGGSKTLVVLKNCTDAISDWILHNGLALNPSKSEVIEFDTAQTLHKSNIQDFIVAESVIAVSDQIKSLRVVFHSTPKWTEHARLYSTTQGPSGTSGILYRTSWTVPWQVSRSSNMHHMEVPRRKLDTGKRALSYAAPTIWNNLPQTIRQMDLASVSLSSFKKTVKDTSFQYCLLLTGWYSSRANESLAIYGAS